MGSGGPMPHQAYSGAAYPGQPSFPPPPGHSQTQGGGFGAQAHSGLYGASEHTTYGGQASGGQYQTFGAPPPPAWR